jgi:hypothetical protein
VSAYIQEEEPVSGFFVEQADVAGDRESPATIKSPSQLVVLKSRIASIADKNIHTIFTFPVQTGVG